MKQILAILTLIASLTFTSCEDFLTEEVRGNKISTPISKV